MCLICIIQGSINNNNSVYLYELTPGIHNSEAHKHNLKQIFIVF
jgi:hypothetical protein